MMPVELKLGILTKRRVGPCVWVNYGGTRRARDIEIYFDGERVSHRSNYDFLNQDFRLDEPLRLGMGWRTFRDG